MKNTYNVLNNLLNFIASNKNITEKEKVEVLVESFFSKEDNKEIPNLNKLKISDIIILESNEEYILIKINLDEPGLLVGKNGKTIKQLGGFLSKTLNKKARIMVKELDLINI